MGFCLDLGGEEPTRSRQTGQSQYTTTNGPVATVLLGWDETWRLKCWLSDAQVVNPIVECSMVTVIVNLMWRHDLVVHF